MAQVSKYPISQEVYTHIFEIFLGTIAHLRIKREITVFLRDFLSPTEQIMLSKRLAIALLLVKGYDWREISKLLRVSTSTIGKISLQYNTGSGYKRVVTTLLKDERMDRFWLDVGEAMAALFSLPGGKSKAWVFMKQDIQKKKRRKPF